MPRTRKTPHTTHGSGVGGRVRHEIRREPRPSRRRETPAQALDRIARELLARLLPACGV